MSGIDWRHEAAKEEFGRSVLRAQESLGGRGIVSAEHFALVKGMSFICAADREDWPCSTARAETTSGGVATEGLREDLLARAIHEYTHLDSEDECDSPGDAVQIAARYRAALSTTPPAPEGPHSDGCAGGCGTNNSDDPPCPAQDHYRASANGTHLFDESCSYCAPAPEGDREGLDVFNLTRAIEHLGQSDEIWLGRPYGDFAEALAAEYDRLANPSPVDDREPGS